MNYGAGEGLAYVHDFNTDIERAQQNQILDDQAKINSMALMQNIVALPAAPTEKWWEDPKAQFYPLRRFR